MYKTIEIWALILPVLFFCVFCDNKMDKTQFERKQALINSSVGTLKSTSNEIFADEDRPVLEYNNENDYFFVKPWNYNKSENADRKYPLIIYLHAASQVKYLKNLYYIGCGYYNWDDDAQTMTSEYNKKIADAFRKKYPCFTLIPQTSEKSWDTNTVITLIENYKKQYRIDTDRIYIHGYGMGSGAIFPLATKYYNSHGQLFAGMILLNTANGEINLPEAVINETSVWLMTGLTGFQPRIDGIRDAYEFIKKHENNSSAVETEQLDYIVSNGKYEHRANTVTLTKNNVEILKRTEYPDDSSVISEFPFWDPAVFEWLFAQTLNDQELAFDPQVIDQPESVEVSSGMRATFSVVAQGSTRLSYEWQKDGEPIPDSDTATYTTPPVTGQDNGSIYNVTVSNTKGTVVSASTVLTVIEETFDKSDRPGLEYNIEYDYFFKKPWNYEKEYNSERKYPLFIYLHGKSQVKYLKNLYYMGMGYYKWSDELQNMTEEYSITFADQFLKNHPCFTFVPQEHGSRWDYNKLIEQIEMLKQKYRIDTNRIYLHGFSMGGGATYKLASDYYNYNGQLFAGIIRMNGYGEYYTLPDVIVANTPVWLVIGLEDNESRITGIRNAYDFLKKHTFYQDAVETSRLNYYVTSRSYSHLANTWTLSINEEPMVRKTEFPERGHFVTEIPFWDPEVIEWLFSKSLKDN